MKSLTVMLTGALVLCFAGSAMAQYQDLRSPDSVSPTAPAAPASQNLRSPDSVAPTEPAAPASQNLRSPDSVAPTEPGLVAPAATSSDLTLPADGGLSTLLIVLISLTGAGALTGAAYATRRLAHHGPPVA